MLTTNTRKRASTRGSWSAEQLVRAGEAIRSGEMGRREASRYFGIPDPTLRRRLQKNDFEKRSLGPSSVLGNQNEQKLTLHIKRLQKYGFAPSRADVRSMAYQLAEQQGIRHSFNKEKEMAGFDWLKMFMKRNPDLSIQQADAVSLARAKRMSKVDVRAYFEILEATLRENNVINKPSNIFNMNETGVQLNNKQGKFIAEIGGKNVVKSAEEGETVAVIACCNAEGSFLPPISIFKGKNRKPELEDGMPPGSAVFMNPKSAYINTSLFLSWLKNHFVPRKPEGKVVLILDGHLTHCNSVEMFEYAEEHDIILVCLPSHTTQFLQPLDGAFFQSFKLNFNLATNRFIKANPNRKITRLLFGLLLASAWTKSATVENAVSAFKATGVSPFNPDAIPDYAYLQSEETEIDLQEGNIEPKEEIIEVKLEIEAEKEQGEQTITIKVVKQNGDEEFDGETPGTFLNKINPIPSMSRAVDEVREQDRQIAAILPSPENIEKRCSLEEKKANLEATDTKTKKASISTFKRKYEKGRGKRTTHPVSESSSDEASDFVPQESDDSVEESDER